MPFDDVSPEMQKLLDKLQDIGKKKAAIDASYASLVQEEDDTRLALQNICPHDITIGYGVFIDERGVEYPGFKCCSTCEKVLQGD